MRTLTSIIMISVCCSLVSSTALAKKRPSKAKTQEKAEITSESKEIDNAKEEVAIPTEQDPAQLEAGANAMPAPPSMEDLLVQGGGPASKAAEIKSNTPGAMPASSGGFSALALGFGLFLVGGGLGAGVMIARQKNQGGLMSGLPAHHLKHVKSIRLSPKHQISLIEAQGRQLVIGVTSAQITLLANLEEEDDQWFAQGEEGMLTNLQTKAAEAKQKTSEVTSSNWDELFTSAIKQREENLSKKKNTPDPENRTRPRLVADNTKSFEGLPPSVAPQTVDVPALEEPEPVQEPIQEPVLEEADEATSIVHETEDYTLEENSNVLPFDTSKIERHDGMFAQHDAVHHADEAPSAATTASAMRQQKTRRSRESDSMLIALAAMREEASR